MGIKDKKLLCRRCFKCQHWVEFHSAIELIGIGYCNNKRSHNFAFVISGNKTGCRFFELNKKENTEWK